MLLKLRSSCPTTMMMLLWLVTCCPCNTTFAADFRTDKTESGISIHTDNYGIDIHFKGFRYTLLNAAGKVIAPAHKTSGLFFHGGDAAETVIDRIDEDAVHLRVTNEAGVVADVRVLPTVDTLRLSVHVQEPKADDRRIILRTGGVTPAFGLGDNAGWRETTDLTGFTSDSVRATDPIGSVRLISNFVIFPKQRFAEVNVEPRTKIVHITTEENAQGVVDGHELPGMYYFFGEPKQIYAAFHRVRNSDGYNVYKPKYEWFGVGWEAYGALAWNTNQATVTENVQRYLDEGYPLRWMVVGSGFWPHSDPGLEATTSFGLWDKQLYPDPRGLIRHFHELGLKFMLGIRISFICEGPYASEGVEKGYFLKENGQAKVFNLSFPERPVYLLDAQNADAVRWYLDLCDRWSEYGVDGFKEDLYGYGNYDLPDDRLDPVNNLMMERGIYLMGRNGYLTPPGDIQRFNDFNFNHNQDRGPINGLCLAYCGMFNVYPDIVGGTGLATNKFSDVPIETLKTYFMHYAQYASAYPSMSFGYGPWNFDDPQVDRVCLEAANLHARLQPYFYSSAIDSWKTGFPHTMCPLPLLWPDEPGVYEMENNKRRSYQWMLGDSLLATPIYGEDFATATTRNVFIPPGRWMDYETGEVYAGPRVLNDFPLPLGKAPLFVGGKGIIALLDDVDGSMHASVYPVAESGTAWAFNWPDGESISTIIVEGSDTPHGDIMIEDVTTSSPVDYTVQHETGAVIFAIIKKHDYRIVRGG
ncbi:MAG: glycoside hydrolase family 31 protein [Phycisphaerales bacterium]